MRKSIGLLAVADAIVVGCSKDKVEVIDGVKIQIHAHDSKAQKLKDGDIITTSIEGLGVLINKCIRISDHSRADWIPEMMKPMIEKLKG